MTEAPERILLGPQNPVRNIGEAVASANLPEGPIAVVSAGWQEAEGDLGELQDIVGRPLEDLGIYVRADAAMAVDEDLAAAHRLRQDRLQERQRLYRLRLKSLALAARRLHRLDDDGDILTAERRHAIKQLRALDRHHLRKCEALYSDFEQSLDLTNRNSLIAHRADIKSILERSVAVIVTGGNIGVLINRLRLFALGEFLDGLPVIGWSAGAMVMAERIVLFHDRMPEGRRDPEVFGHGLGLVEGIIPMPDARHRLRDDARRRYALMARRFAPGTCVTLNNGDLLRWRDGRVVEASGARRFERAGRLGRIRAA